jgi:hypothetical protein
MSLVKLISGEPFDANVDRHQYVLFDAGGKTSIVDDQAWDQLMAVMDSISKKRRESRL